MQLYCQQNVHGSCPDVGDHRLTSAYETEFDGEVAPDAQEQTKKRNSTARGDDEQKWRRRHSGEHNVTEAKDPRAQG